MQRYDHFINGAWSEPNKGKTIESIDPATGEV
jgi:acyl-CoA reductase-like NAD-dependent aldehyde dehydrogenase